MHVPLSLTVLLLLLLLVLLLLLLLLQSVRAGRAHESLRRSPRGSRWRDNVRLPSRSAVHIFTCCCCCCCRCCCCCCWGAPLSFFLSVFVSFVRSDSSKTLHTFEGPSAHKRHSPPHRGPTIGPAGPPIDPGGPPLDSGGPPLDSGGPPLDSGAPQKHLQCPSLQCIERSCRGHLWCPCGVCTAAGGPPGGPLKGPLRAPLKGPHRGPNRGPIGGPPIFRRALGAPTTGGGPKAVVGLKGMK